MKKVYHCFRCGKWFEHPRRQDEDGFRTLELCPNGEAQANEQDFYFDAKRDWTS